jgi:2-polyprenyl-3-methyl-5-hydroxy-6-metoxy-1,4-benzoquinol methylase
MPTAATSSSSSIVRFEACKVCGAAPLALEDNQLGLVRCSQCNLVFARRSYSPEELSALYGELYTPGGEYDMHLKQLDSLRTHGHARIGFDRETVLKNLLAQHPKNVVELGAGVGIVAAWLRSRNVSYRGFEFNPEIAGQARQIGLPVEHGDHGNLRQLAEPVDAIVAFEVIEHVQDIGECLTSIRSALKPSGFFAFTTPNYDKRLNNADHSVLGQPGPPIHLNFWNAASLQNTLRNYGFSVVMFRQRTRPFVDFKYWANCLRAYARWLVGRNHGNVLLCIARRDNAVSSNGSAR